MQHSNVRPANSSRHLDESVHRCQGCLHHTPLGLINTATKVHQYDLLDSRRWLVVWRWVYPGLPHHTFPGSAVMHGNGVPHRFCVCSSPHKPLFQLPSPQQPLELPVAPPFPTPATHHQPGSRASTRTTATPLSPTGGSVSISSPRPADPSGPRPYCSTAYVCAREGRM
jgi:hypothetical protein